jgi:hypothetical protein
MAYTIHGKGFFMAVSVLILLSPSVKLIAVGVRMMVGGLSPESCVTQLENDNGKR